MMEVYRTIGRVSPSNASVFLTGESGTGKELAARTIHDQSERRDRIFLPINCGAMAPSLVESELFGHEKGSFTGAQRLHRGYFERATGGTLFLDEITEMPPDLQVKLLRVLESDTLLRIGGDKPIKVDVRVIAATNLDPEAAVASRQLRADLFYRLMVFPIQLPALRQRGEDVILLAEFFLDRLQGSIDPKKLLNEAGKERLRSKYWPGNVRQLMNSMEHALIMSDAPSIGSQDFPSDLVRPPTAVSPEAAGRSDGSRLTFKIGLRMEEVERSLILATLEFAGGSRKRAAQILGISPKTLYNRLLQYAR